MRRLLPSDASLLVTLQASSATCYRRSRSSRPARRPMQGYSPSSRMCTTRPLTAARTLMLPSPQWECFSSCLCVSLQQFRCKTLKTYEYRWAQTYQLCTADHLFSYFFQTLNQILSCEVLCNNIYLINWILTALMLCALKVTMSTYLFLLSIWSVWKERDGCCCFCFPTTGDSSVPLLCIALPLTPAGFSHPDAFYGFIVSLAPSCSCGTFSFSILHPGESFSVIILPWLPPVSPLS